MGIALNGKFQFLLDGAPGLALTDSAGRAAVALGAGCKEYAEAVSVRDMGGGYEAEYRSPRWQVRDLVVPEGGSVARLERTWTYTGDTAFEGNLTVELITAFEPEYYLIPSVSYDGNRVGRGKEPKGLSLAGADWLYSYERTSLPAATFAERPGLCTGLFAIPAGAQSLLSSCGLSASGKRLVHRLVYPEAEEPLCYSDTDTYGEGWRDTVALEKNRSFTATCCVYLKAGAAFRSGWFDAYRYYLGAHSPKPANRFTAAELWDLGLGYMRSRLWVDDIGFTGFSVGMLPGGVHSKGAPGKAWRQRLRGRYEIGWAGQNYAMALLLMQDHISRGGRQSLDDAVRMFDLWEKNARSANGLFHAMYDDLLDGRRDATVDTCNLGWGALMAMEGYETAKRLGLDRPAWLDMGLRCCGFFLEAWRSLGTFGKLWELGSGRCVDESGTIGAFMLMPMLKAHCLTGDRSYLDCAAAAFRFYAERDLERMACHAGALDTDCIDCETAYPLLDAAIRLHEITGEKAYLESAVRAAQFIATWVYVYDVIPAPGSDFEKLGIRTAGLGAVSTQHHHLHNGPLYFVKDWLRLGELTGDGIWTRYARLVWAGAQQAISDGTLELHGMVRPRGAENEAYMQCRWGLHENGGGRHYLNDWLVAWPVTFRLLCLTGPDRDRVAATLDAEN